MTRPDIDAIRARVEATTEGPWEKSEALDSTEYGDYVAYGVLQVAPITQYWDSAPAHTSLEVMSAEDAEFIAHARQDVPALLAYVEQLEAQIERVRGLHKRVHAVGTRSGLRYEDPCPECDGKKGVHDCGCWGAFDTVFVCAECHRLGSGSKGVYDYAYPCPTIKALGIEVSDE